MLETLWNHLHNKAAGDDDVNLLSWSELMGELDWVQHFGGWGNGLESWDNITFQPQPIYDE